jgi:hypothetical protein
MNFARQKTKLPCVNRVPYVKVEEMTPVDARTPPALAKKRMRGAFSFVHFMV